MSRSGGIERLVRADLRNRPIRAAALAIGLLVASVSFVLLTAAVGTSQARVTGSVRSNFRPAYDLLVRPTGAATQLKARQSLVPDNFGSGLFGGISFAQYRRIGGLAGVDVAAPVANIGYVLASTTVQIPVNAYLDDSPVQLFRVRTRDATQRGLSTFPAGISYAYYTRQHPFVQVNSAGLAVEKTPAGNLDVCEGLYKGAPTQKSPYDVSVPGMECFSALTPNQRFSLLPPGTVGVTLLRQYPLLLSAVDPVQEARLIHLNKSITGGRYLRATDTVRQIRHVPVYGHEPAVPVILDSHTYLDDTLQIQIQKLSITNAADVPKTLASAAARAYLAGLTGPMVARQQRPAAKDYPGVLRTYAHNPRQAGISDLSEYRTSSSVSYREQHGGLAPTIMRNPNSVWHSNFTHGYLHVPPANADLGFRRLGVVEGTNAANPDGSPLLPTAIAVGQFDPKRLPSFSPLSRVPLETYYPPQVTGADARSKAVLGGKSLLPDANIAGYLTQPPAMLTTLTAARASFWNRKLYANAPKAPISYIRVRVAGVSGPDKLSVARINAVATEIRKATGLNVDITAGGSPAPQTIRLPAGRFGRPSLNISEGWVKKNVAVSFLTAADRKSLVLLVLVLVVCVLFLGNAALAAERARRTDLGVLSCLGWSRRSLFGYVLGQQAAIGLVAGLLGTGIGAGLVLGLDLSLPGWRLALITPVAVALACAAGLQAALRAARATPIEAVAAPVARLRKARRVRSLAALAAANVRRVPGRSIAAGAALFVAVAALTIILGITLAYRGVLVGTLLGDAVSVQIRGVDYLAAALILALGAASQADVIYLNITERGPEIATLTALGWSTTTVRALFAMEGLIITLTASVLGAAAGLAFVTTSFNVAAGSVIAGAGAATAAGAAATALAMLVPLAQVARRGPASQLAAVE